MVSTKKGVLMDTTYYTKDEKRYVFRSCNGIIAGNGPNREVVCMSNQAFNDDVVRPIELTFRLLAQEAVLPFMNSGADCDELVSVKIIGCANMIRWLGSNGKPINGPDAARVKKRFCLIELVGVSIPASWRGHGGSKFSSSNGRLIDTALIEYDTQDKEGRLVECTLL
jgi:hypothetical protein